MLLKKHVLPIQRYGKTTAFSKKRIIFILKLCQFYERLFNISISLQKALDGEKGLDIVFFKCSSTNRSISKKVFYAKSEKIN